VSMREKGGPTEVMYGRVTQGTTEKFKNAIPRGFRQGDCLTAAIEMWAELPEEVRIEKLIGRLEGTLEERIERVLEEKFAEGVVAGKWVIKARRQAKRSSR